MNSLFSPFQYKKSRLGFHYFPDATHYRECDLQLWLPKLLSLNASWLVLRSSLERAIPEHFIRGLVEKEIEPIIHFDIPPAHYPDPSELNPILAAYAHWGVNGIILYDRPNSRSSWHSSSWTQQDLVQRFLDRYIPLAATTLENNLIPIFPPLEPGGSYWDTTFLRSSLESLVNQKQTSILQNLVLSAYVWTNNHSLNWGAGGPKHWPTARPYFSSPDDQDQRGFRIFDWYSAVSTSIFGKPCPIILLGAGIPGNPFQSRSIDFSVDQHTNTNLAIAKLILGNVVNDPKDTQTILEPVPDEIIACNFWLLVSDSNNPSSSHAWYKLDGTELPIVKEIHSLTSESKDINEFTTGSFIKQNNEDHNRRDSNISTHAIRHYLLLPTYEWGVADWHLDVIRPYIKKHRPTVGFSLNEALLASKVTIVGNPLNFPDEIIHNLQQAGCIVERIDGDGTTIATQLAEK